MASKRDKKTGYVYRRRNKLEKRFDEIFEAEQKLLRMEREMGTNNPCSKDQFCGKDPFIDPDEATFADVVKTLNLLSGLIGQLNRRLDSVQKEVDDVKERVVRIETAMDSTLSKVEKVKDIVMANETAADVIPLVKGFKFERITEERQLHELENRLATDTEYVTNITNWLKRKITTQIHYNRLFQAMDIVFDRQFMPQCNWKGRRKVNPKLALREKTHILELFRVVGGNQFTPITDGFVTEFFRKNLPYAKFRAQRDLAYRNRKGALKYRRTEDQMINTDPLKAERYRFKNME